MNTAPRADWNPYLAGVFLGLVLLATFVLMGFGLGSSSAVTRVAYNAVHMVAPATVEGNSYMAPYVAHTAGASPFEDWMIFEVIGVFLGGLLGATSGRRLHAPHLLRGPNATRNQRILFALLGGALMGFGARLARGCTSGQALTGGAALSVGSWVFMLAVFAGGYMMAPFVRRLWR